MSARSAAAGGKTATSSGSKRPRDSSSTARSSAAATSAAAANAGSATGERAAKQARSSASSSAASAAIAASPPPLPATPADAPDDSLLSRIHEPLPSSLHPSSSAAAAASPSSSGPYVPQLLQTLIPNPSVLEQNFNSKLKDRLIMLDASTKTSASGSSALNVGEAAAKRERKRRKKRGISMMSSNQRKAAGIAHIPKENLQYAAFLPLHQLWVQYMHDILDPQHARGLSTVERVLKADYHGAILTVVRSRSPTHVGLRGILIHETQETMQILSQSNSLKIVPKRHSVFAFAVPPRNAVATAVKSGGAESSAASASSSSSPSGHQVFELFGDHLCFRSYERSSRKFKAKATIQL